MSEKEKNIFVDNILKKFGKESGVIVQDLNNMHIEKFKTGSVKLNYGLKGGYPRGKIVEFSGDTGSGKCLTEDNYILTSKGWYTLKELFNENGEETFNVIKDVEKNISLINRDGEREDTTHFTFNGKRKVLEITTQYGDFIKSTYKHPILVLNDLGDHVWKEARYIEKGDVLVINNNHENSFGDNCIPKELAYMYGIIIADGGLNGGKLGITNDNEYIKNFIEKNYKKVLNLSSVKQYLNNDKGSINYRFALGENYNKWDDWFEEFDLTKCLSKNKIVPLSIRKSDRDTIIYFLKGFVDCEGYFTEQNIEVTSASKDLIYQIKLLLKQLGIRSSLNIKKVDNYPNNIYYRLYIGGEEYNKYYDIIGSNVYFKKSNNNSNTSYSMTPSISTRLMQSLYDSTEISKRSRGLYKKLSFLLKKGATGLSERHIPLIEELVRIGGDIQIANKIKRLLAFDYHTVDTIVELEEEKTFDVSLPKTHSFVTNTIINHNTTLCIEGAVEFQNEYPDELILWVDLEDVYDPEYNESLGLDTSTNFILAKPKTGEQAWDLIVEFAKTSKGGLIVLDSVTLLLPESEDEGDMGDASMALAARMNSKGLRKLMPHLSKNKVTFFVVNQIREKIGGYGNPNVTTGGKGWAFYARTRIECSVQKGELTVSSNHRFKLTKATYGTKDFVVESSIVYGKGIDYLSEIIDMAVDMEIIKKAGSWFSYKETKIGQGKNAVKEILEDNPELLEEIENKLA